MGKIFRLTVTPPKIIPLSGDQCIQLAAYPDPRTTRTSRDNCVEYCAMAAHALPRISLRKYLAMCLFPTEIKTCRTRYPRTLMLAHLYFTHRIITQKWSAMPHNFALTELVFSAYFSKFRPNNRRTWISGNHLTSLMPIHYFWNHIAIALFPRTTI